MRGRRGAHGRGADRGDARPEEPARRPLAAARGRVLARGLSRSTICYALVQRAYPYRDLPRGPVRRRARPARRALPVRRVRRAAAPSRVGPRRGHRASARRRDPDRDRERRDDPRPRPLRRLPGGRRRGASASSTRRWSTRRARARCSCSEPARGGSRRSRATACSSPPLPACPARSRSGRAIRSAGRRSSEAPSGSCRRELALLPDEAAERQLVEQCACEPRAASNLVAFVREQERATGVVPSDRTIVVERFRDEIGDWRLCILSPFGGRVHAPWALALGAELRRATGIEAQALWSDDGIIVHLPDTDVAARCGARRARPRDASRTSSSASSAAPRCTARASARTPRARS